MKNETTTPEANRVEYPRERYDRNDSYTVIAIEDVMDVIEANDNGTLQAQHGNSTTFIDLAETGQYEIVEGDGAIHFRDPEDDFISKSILGGKNARILVRDAIVPAIDSEGDGTK